MSRTALEGLRVLDLTDLRGALTGRILADLGAEVIRVPIVEGSPLHRDGMADAHRNANKFRVDPDRVDLPDLVAGADVVVDNTPAARVELGLLDVDDLFAAHPSLIQVCVRDMGMTGPRAGWHLDPLPALAASGGLFVTGFPDRAPCWLPVHLAHDCAGVQAALGAVAAVTDRRRHGAGDVIEVSVQEAAIAGLVPWSVCIEDYLHINPLLPAAGTRNADGSYWVLPAKDGHVRMVIGSTAQWRGFVELCNNPDALLSDEWDDPIFRLMNSDVIRVVAAGALVDRTRAELFDQALELSTTLGVLQEPHEFVEHAHVVERGCFTEVEGFGALIGAPWRLSATPSPPPRLESVAGSGWLSPGWSCTDVRGSRDTSLPLDGVRVVEFGVAAVVPELAWMLYELGADVIKVESSSHPDLLRRAGGARIDCSFAFNAECRGRRSVALDLSTQDGRDIALRLCLEADVVAENQRGGSLVKLGLDYDDVVAGNPSVIYAASQGYGRTGPMSEMPAFGPLNSGFAGLHSLWNHPDSPYPCGTSMNHPDHVAGKLLGVAVIAALDHRRITGEGQLIDMAQTEAAAYMAGELYADSVAPRANGNRLDDQCPHDVYRCDGPDRWVAISVADDEAWAQLADLLGLDSLAGLSASERCARRDEIDALVAGWTSVRDADDAASVLQSVGVSAMAVLGPADHRNDGHLEARRFLVDLEHEEVGSERHVGNPTRFRFTGTRVAPSARPLGADTVEVLGEVLGIGEDEVAELVDRGVCR